MPLTDLNQPMKQSASGAVFFAADATGARVMVTIMAPVIDYYRDSDPPPTNEGFRAFALEVASGLYDAGPRDGQVILDMEALDLPA